MQKINDITELLFPREDLSRQEKLEIKLWKKATQEAYREVGDSSPLALLRKTEEIYNRYLKKNEKT